MITSELLGAAPDVVIAGEAEVVVEPDPIPVGVPIAIYGRRTGSPVSW